MFQLSKKVEYGLIAIRHMASCPQGQIVTAKEIADLYHLPPGLLAKVMQKLARKGYIASYQGVHGGYHLVRNPHTLKVSELINAIQGQPGVAIMQCAAERPENCIIHSTCTIKSPMVKLQNNINRVFEELTVMEMM